jgi:hypothetical protein
VEVDVNQHIEPIAIGEGDVLKLYVTAGSTQGDGVLPGTHSPGRSISDTRGAGPGRGRQIDQEAQPLDRRIKHQDVEIMAKARRW